MEKEINIKEKILNSLSGEFEVTKVERVDGESSISIYCEFIKKGNEGNFYYLLEGGERGIEELNYCYDDDIEREIHEWFWENIDWETTIEWKGKRVS